MAAHRYWQLATTAAAGGAGWLAISELQGVETRTGPNVLTGGTASSPSNYPGFPPSNAFDGNINTSWIETPGSGGQENFPVHLNYDLGVGVTKDIQQITILARQGTPSQNPTAFDWRFSDDGVNYTTYFSGTSPVFSSDSDSATAGILPTVLQSEQIFILGVEQVSPPAIQIQQIIMLGVLSGDGHVQGLGPVVQLGCWTPCGTLLYNGE